MWCKRHRGPLNRRDRAIDYIKGKRMYDKRNDVGLLFVRRAAGLILVFLCVHALSGCGRVWQTFERTTLNPGVRSNATPGDVRLKFERISIPIGQRKLDSFVVRAELSCRGTAAVLIFHGRRETIADWIGVQRLLHDACISSMTFDYSGHGRSSPPGTIENLNADSNAAYDEFFNLFPRPERRCMLSHSLGGGPMLHAAVAARVGPDCVVIASPFSSLREIAVRGGMPRWLSWLASDAWDNVELASQLAAPMLWIHSRSDTTIPIELGHAVFDAKKGEKSALVLTGFGHNAIYESRPTQLWTPVVTFILGKR